MLGFVGGYANCVTLCVFRVHCLLVVVGCVVCGCLLVVCFVCC